MKALFPLPWPHRTDDPYFYGHDACFAPDVMLPEQFLEQTPEPDPERRLRIEVLRDVASLLLRQSAGRDETRTHPSRDVREAEAWVRSNDTTWPYSFLPLCEALDVDASAMRRALLALRLPTTKTTISARHPGVGGNGAALANSFT